MIITVSASHEGATIAPAKHSSGPVALGALHYFRANTEKHLEVLQQARHS